MSSEERFRREVANLAWWGMMTCFTLAAAGSIALIVVIANV